ncbi:hypothetical protein CJ195_18635 [Bacillus sp. UMB0899]|uniref:hypothetical protein n=1 Tax=Metabacillus schmidteae TaxID=2730405 RepID=UPI000C7F9C5D|nr:hypothetical protein [Metabacillus schmidteae]PMC35429.1 hypothetical protein CJ195_18635 [Bacillus sp. UMB0899]
MNKKGAPTIKRGQAITFRLPSDTPDHLIKQLEKLKQTEKRNFSSKIAEFVLEGVGSSLAKDREMVSLPMPKQLSKDQRNWLKHSHSEALLGSIVYQILSDPVRATSILASLTSNALDIDEALYLQEMDVDGKQDLDQIDTIEPIITEEEWAPGVDDDDILDFDFDRTERELASSKEDTHEESEEMEDLLGDFLAKMNK